MQQQMTKCILGDKPHKISSSSKIFEEILGWRENEKMHEKINVRSTLRQVKVRKVKV